MGNLFKPFMSYNNETAFIYPNEAREDYAEPHEQNANDTHGGGRSGTLTRYEWGTHDFIHVRFQYQSATLKAEWETYRSAVEAGQVHVYHDDDSYSKFGSFTYGDGTVYGDLQTGGAADRQLLVTLVSMSIDPTDVYELWDVTLDLRRVA